MKKSIVIKPLPFIFQLALSLGIGSLVGLLTRSSDFFETLQKPPLTPLPIVFIIAWSIFYILMAVSITLILSNPKAEGSSAVSVYYAQLAVNFLWPVIFFVLGQLPLAFVWLLLLIGLVITMIVRFYRYSKTAALLQIPYLLWLLFATYLNLGYIILN